MSPSEDDLRASLKRDEGERPDVDRAVAAGAAARTQRRQRVLGVAASVVVVAAVAAVIGVSTRGSNTPAAGPEKMISSGAPRGIASGEPNPGSSNSPSPSPTASVTPAPCPASFPRRLLPGGGSSQFGGEKMFARDAVAIRVCSYQLTAVTTDIPADVVVTGDEARILQRSLENAPRGQSGVKCRAVLEPSLAFVAVAADGTAMRTVTVQNPSCGSMVTNGSAVRFDWVPPAGFDQLLRSLLPSAAPGTKGGSPTR